MVFFLFLVLVAYVIPVVNNALSLRRFRKCIRLLTEFILIYGDSTSYSRPKSEEYNQELTALLRYYPVMAEYVSYPKLTYEDSVEKTFENSKKLLSKFQMLSNAKRHKLLRSLNPLFSMKEFVMLPVTAVRECGAAPGVKASIAINVLGWLIAYLLDTFRPEIKALLLVALQHFI